MIEKKRYCLDTSGLSNPLESMPENIPMYQPIWVHVTTQIESGILAVNLEIYDELFCLPGQIGTCLNNNRNNLVLEVGENWDWQTYLGNVERMRTTHKDIISEYNGGAGRELLALTMFQLSHWQKL